MYAKIIPLIKLPRKFEYFDYIVPEEIKNKIQIGHLVVVYFRNQKIKGVVIEISKTTNTDIKKIKKIDSLTEVVLPKTLLDAVNFASKEYIASSSSFYKNIIPTFDIKIKDEENAINTTPLLLTKNEVKNVVDILKNWQNNNNFFLYENNFKEILAVFIKLIEKNLNNKKQVLILAPTLQDLENFESYLKYQFKENLIVWRTKDNKNTKYKNWLKILRGEPCIILGTRPACFLPFKNLALVSIYNSTSPDYKQWDMNPRYNAKEILEFICKKNNINLLLTDYFPSLDTFKKISDGEICELNKPIREKELILADLRKEAGAKQSLITFPVYQMMKEAHKLNKRVILLINRQENDKIFICNDCDNIFKCPKCKKPFVIDNNHFFCYYCRDQQAPIPDTCPNCNGLGLKALREGIKTIKKYIENELAIEVHTVSKDNLEFKKDFRVLLTTDCFWKNIFHKINKNEIYGSAILDFDFYLTRPEFNQRENAALALERFLSFANNLNLKKTVIQTAKLDNKIFESIPEFYKEELEERKSALYPPFGKLIKIICKDKIEQKLESDSNKLYNLLKEKGYHPMPPFSPYNKKRKKNHLKHIILKENLNKDLSKLIHIIPDEYQIDVNPISIY